MHELNVTSSLQQYDNIVTFIAVQQFIYIIYTVGTNLHNLVTITFDACRIYERHFLVHKYDTFHDNKFMNKSTYPN